MPGKEIKGRSKIANYRHGGHVNTPRENRLEELGRVDAEKAYTGKRKKKS